MSAEIKEPQTDVISGINIDDIWTSFIDSSLVYRESPPFLLQMYIKTFRITTLVDTASQCTLMDLATWNAFKVNTQLQPAEVQLKIDCHMDLPISGKVTVPCAIQNNLYKIEWIIINSNLPYAI